MQEVTWLRQGLTDAGCEEPLKKEMLHYARHQEWDIVLSCLRRYKQKTLSRLHQVEAQVDCLDDLIYHISKRQEDK